jgi:subtilisin family serine protease
MSEKRRVVTYPMHESEAAEAHSALDAVVTAEDLVIGEADSSVIDTLRSKGIVVRDLGPAERTPSMPPSPPVAVGGYLVVKLREPLCAPHQAALETAGLELTDRLGHRAFVGRVKEPSAPGNVAVLSFVDSVKTYATPVRRTRTARRAPATGGGATAPSQLAAVPSPTPEKTYDLFLQAAEHQPAVQAAATRRGLSILGSSPRKLRVSGNPADAEALGGLEGVALVDEYVPPKLYNEHARGVVWPGPPPGLPLTGEGEIVAVADSGVDADHVVLRQRVLKTFAHGRAGDASDPHGHGTHVAGTIAGENGLQRGFAPSARLVFQSVMDAGGGLAFPVDLGALFAEAYAEGARIHSDSWGADLDAAYAMTSFEVDAFVHEHKDMLVVVAAGNAGSALDPSEGPRRALAGFVEWGSVGAPATSKNALVVGASRSDRQQGGLSKLTYGEAYDRFVQPPIAGELISGNPECIAAFSSRGPCNDHRIKPDVVAPGTDILSAKARTAPPANFSGVEKHDGAEYGFMGGTSMATPLVAGMAALVRQYLREKRNYAAPSAALIKAIITNGTRRLSGPDALADQQRELPNFHQGFGGVFMPTTLPLDESYVLAFADNWQNQAEHLSRAGMRRRFRFRLRDQGPLRVTLAYTDAPGRGIQNDLSLILELPGGEKHLGNEHTPLAIFHPDPDNNVEVVRIDDAPAGEYLVAVSATTILHPPQDFALVVTGALLEAELEKA